VKEKTMSIPVSRCLLAMALASAAVPARAQLAVIDVPAIAQLVQEVQTMERAVETAESQLAQAKQALQTMTGTRGMQLLLSGTTRNYLPVSYAQLASAMQGGGGYPLLSLNVQSTMAANAVLTPQQLASLSAPNQQQVLAGRQRSALQQALAQQALANASNRFAALQSLIDAIGTATDQKGILDLQARINAELGMLQNEQTKLLVLNQATHAQEALARQQQWEQIIAGHGSFASRFQPAP
jgi:type IV secretion system protein VirB5